MAAKETCVNPKARKQAAASKDKPGEASANRKGVDDPDYENITLTFRNQDQAKGSYSPPKSKAWARPSSDSAQPSRWLHTAFMSLYVLLALLSIILLSWVLVNNSKMSQELLALKGELWNNVRECQEKQKQGWSRIYQRVFERLGLIKNGTEKLKMLPTDVTQIRNQLSKVFEMLQKMQNQCELGPVWVEPWPQPSLLSQECLSDRGSLPPSPTESTSE
ncbi:mast cell-expressed membrane protein 1 isoform X1 [Sturnira hondurensis]|uniref:mast cell-expressed membrane protein 1 isoform X1 n=2 Tax=Sturnira hondurensis TaxID=192404 RepID=UPI00187A9685|nr:mast cell-expressed membrane protein 1 isoform X1 [Sturnira hondurensis]